MNRTQLKQKSTAQRRKADIDALVDNIMRHLDSPERVMELYFWSREPELLEVIRAVAAMPATSQAAIGTFLAMAGDGQSVNATIDGGGNLVLQSPRVAQELAAVVETHEAYIELTPGASPRIH